MKLFLIILSLVKIRYNYLSYNVLQNVATCFISNFG